MVFESKGALVVVEGVYRQGLHVVSAHFLGGRKSATKFLGTLGRSSWTYSDIRFILSSNPALGARYDGH